MKYLILVIYITVTIYTCRKIWNSIILTKKQKIVNCILNAIAPVLRYYLIRKIIFPENKVMTKTERERLGKNKSADTSLPTVMHDGNAL